MRFDDLALPDSRAATAALEVAGRYCSPALLNHSIRSYLWAASFAAARDVSFDAELLYVSAMLHDIGLVAAFDSHTVAFDRSGGDVAWVLGAGRGWPTQRRVRAGEIILRHMWDTVDVAVDPEGHLLELATALDISGRNPDDWPADLRAEVLQRLPRLGLAQEFTRCFVDQAERKPDSSPAAAPRSGVAERIATNPLDSI